MSTQFVQLRHARTAFRVRGEGPPLLRIHGAEASGASFEALAALLSKTMTVYAYDQRECGQTETEQPATLLTERFANKRAMSSARTNLIRQVHPLPPSRIGQPALLISGSNDDVVPSRIMRDIHLKIPGSTLVEMKGGHHAITVERPAEVAREIEHFVREGLAR